MVLTFSGPRIVVTAASIAAAMVIAACGRASAPPPAMTPGTSATSPATVTATTFVPPAGEAVGRVAEPALDELSGMAASRTRPGVFWAHNDSGGAARLYAFTLDGAAAGTLDLAGAEAFDWEDMAAGPGPDAGTSYLYAGDIGDNIGQRESIAVYRVAEPADGDASASLPAEPFELRYSDGAHPDAEALLVDPQSGDVYVVQKRIIGSATVYRASAPLRADAPNDLDPVAAVNLIGPITGGDIAPDGTIALRTYTDAYLWFRAPGESIVDAFGRQGQRVPLVLEQQGEAIAFTLDSTAFLTSSEGDHPAIYRYAFR